MTIYEHKTSMLTVSGSVATTSLNIRGGLLRYLLVRANTDTTIFKVHLQDNNSVTRLNYAYHAGELVDDKIAMPMAGQYTINITNASPDDTFRIIAAVEE